MAKHRKRICKYGHDTFIYGRNKNNYCNECMRLRVLKWAHEHKEEKKAYDKIYKTEHKDIIKEQKKQWREDNQEAIRIWLKNYYIEHEEKIKEQRRKRDKENRKELLRREKEYQKTHPEIYKLASLRHHEKRKLRLAQWGQEGMTEFYRNMTKDMSEDHIIPLCGVMVSGLHVIWNLQYLPLYDNFTKSNKIDLLEASEWYGKLLEEIGLK